MKIHLNQCTCTCRMYLSKQTMHVLFCNVNTVDVVLQVDTSSRVITTCHRDTVEGFKGVTIFTTRHKLFFLHCFMHVYLFVL